MMLSLLKTDFLTEASHSNVCIVKAGVIWTPATNEHMIRGVTRSLVLTRAAPSAGVTSIDEASEPVRFEDMMTAEEVFLTNSQDGIIPVLSIDGNLIGGGKVGDVTQKDPRTLCAFNGGRTPVTFNLKRSRSSDLFCFADVSLEQRISIFCL